MDYPGGGTEKRDGGPAFPCVANSLGMSLRDYFAAQALVGFMAMTEAVGATAREDGVPHTVALSHACYDVADAMLAARDR